ncbi:MAG: ferritin-like domain-containing protein [Endomicrobiales bacterium]|nr:ferritin-like domain-containing protein [Endomicrobiales bacterium]
MTMKNNKKMMALLNQVLQQEYLEVFTYLKEAELFRKKLSGGENLGQIFENFSQEELRHVDRISAKLIELGERPSWSFRNVEIPDSIHEALKAHILQERKIYGIYTDIIENCTDADFKIVLKGIREQEKEHLEKAAHILRKLGG